MGDRRKEDAIAAITTWVPGRHLDVCCGRGEFIAILRSRGFECLGTEIVPSLTKPDIVQAWPDDLPFNDCEFDTVSCLDVIEHTIPGEEEAIIAELGRVCRGEVLIAINLKESGYEGVQLHQNLKPLSEWTTILLRNLHGMDLLSLNAKGFSPVWVFGRQ